MATDNPKKQSPAHEKEPFLSTDVKKAIAGAIVAGIFGLIGLVVTQWDKMPWTIRNHNDQWIDEVGYVYYGRNDSGVPSDRGQLRSIDDGLPSVDEIRAGEKFKSVGKKEFRKGSFDASPLIAELPPKTCFVVLERMKPERYEGGNGVWLNVRVIDCPPVSR